jgi:hypothetical protein
MCVVFEFLFAFVHSCCVHIYNYCLLSTLGVEGHYI